MKKAVGAVLIILIAASAAFGAVIYYDDPTAIGVGARPIGMGKAYTAIADGAAAIFINPGGLGAQKRWIVSSMTSNFLNEYQYTTLAAVYPDESGTYGMGYVSSTIGGIETSGGGFTSFYNQAFILSYGNYVGNYLARYVGGERKIYAGFNIKNYQKGFTGDENANGSGINFDTGFKYMHDDRVSYGLNFMNILYGGQMTGDFDPETFPFIIKMGAAYDWKEYNLKFDLDKDIFYGREVPWPMRFGIEWRAHPMLALRAGLDQVAGNSGGGDLRTNLTFGVGFEYKGIRLDLAYVQNFADTNISSVFLSFSLAEVETLYERKEAATEEAAAEKPVLPPPTVKPAQPVQPVKIPATVEAPKKTAEAPPVPARLSPEGVHVKTPSGYTYSETVTITGTTDTNVFGFIIVGDRRAGVGPNGLFYVTVPLKMEKNELLIKVSDQFLEVPVTYRKYIRLFAPANMSMQILKDMDMDYKLICTAMYRYLGSKSYEIDRKVSREILSAIIAQAKKYPLSRKPKQVAADVDAGYWAAPFVEAVVRNGDMPLTAGDFNPRKLISRFELGRVMAKATGRTESFVFNSMSGKALDGFATMADLIDICYDAGFLNSDLQDYKNFLAAPE